MIPCGRGVQVEGKYLDQSTKETENPWGIRSPIHPLDRLFGVKTMWVAPGAIEHRGEISVAGSSADELQLNGAQWILRSPASLARSHQVMQG